MMHFCLARMTNFKYVGEPGDFLCTSKGALVSAQMTKPLAGVAVIAMGLLWVVMGGALLLATEFLQNPTTKCAPGLCALVKQSVCRAWVRRRAAGT